jgi:hypothetical protein
MLLRSSTIASWIFPKNCLHEDIPLHSTHLFSLSQNPDIGLARQQGIRFASRLLTKWMKLFAYTLTVTYLDLDHDHGIGGHGAIDVDLTVVRCGAMGDQFETILSAPLL